jgi:hypothetical protein
MRPSQRVWEQPQTNNVTTPAIPCGALRLVVDTDTHRSLNLDPVLAALQREAIIAARIPST